MAKRFTDTDKWERPWMRGLSMPHKILWCYVLDRCDIAGVWYVDLGAAGFFIGHEYDRQEAEKAFEKQIEVNGDRWLIKDFILFQYGNLGTANRIYRNVEAKLLSFKEGGSIPHISPIYGSKDTDKDKDKTYIKHPKNGRVQPTVENLKAAGLM